MIKVSLDVEGISPLLFNQHLQSKKKSNETHDDWEERCWKERGEYNGDGSLIISGVRFKGCIQTGAHNLNIKIPGSGNHTYTKHFRGGLMVLKGIETGIAMADVQHLRLFTSPKRGQGKRWVHFPLVPEGWTGYVDVNILDEKITKEVFEQVAEYAGMNIGIGALRAESGNDYGRFQVMKFHYE